MVCQKVSLEGRMTTGLEIVEKGSVSFAVGCAITFYNAQVEMTARIKINSRGASITMNSVPGALEHIVAWLKDVAGLDPAPFRALLGPELEVQGFRISLSNAFMSKTILCCGLSTSI